MANALLERNETDETMGRMTPDTIRRGHLTLREWDQTDAAPTKPTRRAYSQTRDTAFGRILDGGVIVLMASAALAAAYCLLHL